MCLCAVGSVDGVDIDASNHTTNVEILIPFLLSCHPTQVLGENDGEAFGAFAAAIGAKQSAKGCGKGIKFSLYATAPDDESAREVLAILDGVAKDSDSVLQELQASAGTGVSCEEG